MKKVLVNLKDHFGLKENEDFANKVKKLDIIVFPSLPFLHLYEDTNVILGAQSISTNESGAHTGSISGEHLKELGIKYVILNHRECPQRDMFKLNSKIENAIKNEIEPIVCIKDEQDLEYIMKCLEDLNEIKGLCVAYEPDIEIPMDEISDMMKKIKETLSIYNIDMFIYGGNISNENIKELDESLQADGYLISRSALNIEELKKIVHSL